MNYHLERNRLLLEIDRANDYFATSKIHIMKKDLETVDTVAKADRNRAAKLARIAAQNKGEVSEIEANPLRQIAKALKLKEPESEIFDLIDSFSLGT